MPWKRQPSTWATTSGDNSSAPASIGASPLRIVISFATTAWFVSGCVTGPLVRDALCTSSPWRAAPHCELHENEQPAQRVAHLGAEDDLVILTTCPDLGDASMLDSVPGLPLTRRGPRSTAEA